MVSAITFEIGVWNAWIFMSAFIFQMMIMMFVGKQIRERSHVPIDARRTMIEKYIGIIANIIWFIALGYSIFLPLLLGTTWFYLGFSIFILGLLLLFFSTYSFVIIVCLHYEAIVEERYCLERFKDKYKGYMHRVPMWFGIPQ